MSSSLPPAPPAPPAPPLAVAVFVRSELEGVVATAAPPAPPGPPTLPGAPGIPGVPFVPIELIGVPTAGLCRASSAPAAMPASSRDRISTSKPRRGPGLTQDSDQNRTLCLGRGPTKCGMADKFASLFTVGRKLRSATPAFPVVMKFDTWSATAADATRSSVSEAGAFDAAQCRAARGRTFSGDDSRDPRRLSAQGRPLPAAGAALLRQGGAGAAVAARARVRRQVRGSLPTRRIGDEPAEPGADALGSAPNRTSARQRAFARFHLTGAAAQI